MFYTYILKSVKDNSFYIGSTQQKEKRLEKHNSGQVRSTKSKRPWKMVYSESYNTLSEARKRELQIKNWKKRIAIETLIGNIGPVV